MMQGKGKMVLLDILKELNEYIKYHFKAEEELMTKCYCSTIDLHKQQHKDFEYKINELLNEYNKGCITMSIDTLNYLKSWFFEHILMEDKLYTNCFNTNGIY